MDAGGNITQASVNLPLQPRLPQSINSLSYDANNRLLSAGSDTYTSDNAGRLIQEDKNKKTQDHIDI